MKNFVTTLSVALLAVALLPGLTLGQKYDTSSRTPSVSGPAPSSTPLPATRSSLVVEEYNSRASFDTDYPTQYLEDFESSVGPVINTQCAPFVNSATGPDACYLPGDIIAGVTFYNDDFPTEGMVVVPAGDLWFGPNNFGSNMIITINPPAAAVGFDIVALLGNNQTIEVATTFNDNSVNSTDLVLPAAPGANFYGIADVGKTIKQLNFINGGSGGTTPPDSTGELINNFVFVDPLALPVELTSFDAVVDGTTATLTWETASEKNNAGFEVERSRSTDEGWARVDFVEGHGTTDEAQVYSLNINDLTPGTHRFRLKQIDFDGAFEYSAIVEATVELPGAYVLEPAFPNPFNPTTNVRFMVAKDQQVRVALFNNAGQEVRELYTGVATANESKLVRVDASGLPSGTYFVRLQGDGFMATEVITLLK